MISQEASRHITNCYMCWMCRHVCPIGLTTGRELHTPRGKALLLNAVIQGNDILSEAAEAIYECFLCNNCSAWCETGFEPTLFIREARRELVAADCLPEHVRPVVDMAIESTLYGEKHFSGALQEEVEALPDQAHVLLVLGDSVVMRQPEIGLSAIRLMKRAGVDFTILKDEPTPAAELYDLVGPLADIQIRAQTLADRIAATGCETVVVVDPFSARIMLQDYPRWGVQLPIVQTAVAYFSQMLSAGRLTVKTKLKKTVTYHDPERLARDLEQTQPPRDIINAIAGSWREIFLNKENARCCGNDIVDAYAPEIVARTARMRMDDAMRTGAELLITASASDKRILNCVDGDSIPAEDILVLLDKCSEGA